jgi:hypothetical protein
MKISFWQSCNTFRPIHRISEALRPKGRGFPERKISIPDIVIYKNCSDYRQVCAGPGEGLFFAEQMPDHYPRGSETATAFHFATCRHNLRCLSKRHRRFCLAERQVPFAI